MQMYPYTKAANIETLRYEIENNSLITIGLDSVIQNGASVEITFLIALPTADETELTNVVNTHDASVSIPSKPNEVVISEELTKTGGHPGFINKVIATGSIAKEVINDVTFPFPISLTSGKYEQSPNMEGDKIKIYVGPDTIVGVTTAIMATTDTVVAVQQSVIDNCFIGMSCVIDTQDVGRIISIDSTALTITIETEPTTQIAAGKYVKITVKMMPEIFLGKESFMISVGENKIGASYIKANTIIRLIYENMDGVNKGNFYVHLDYLY